MNPFQKQLLLRGGKCMAEISNPVRDGIGQPLPPVKVSVEEWLERSDQERCEDMKGLKVSSCKRCGNPCFGFLCAECLR